MAGGLSEFPKVCHPAFFAECVCEQLETVFGLPLSVVQITVQATRECQASAEMFTGQFSIGAVAKQHRIKLNVGQLVVEVNSKPMPLVRRWP